MSIIWMQFRLQLVGGMVGKAIPKVGDFDNGSSSLTSFSENGSCHYKEK